MGGLVVCVGFCDVKLFIIVLSDDFDLGLLLLFML